MIIIMDGHENNLKFNILVIEDDPVITEFLRTGLGYEGYEVATAGDAASGLRALREKPYDLVILDVMLPDIDGFETCRRLRRSGSDVPVLMLTVKKEVSDRVEGLDSGADDYLTKPFSFAELLARIRALLRRSGKRPEKTRLEAGSLTLDRETRQVTRNGREITLTPTEFRLLELFMRYPRRVFTRETLLNRVMGYEYDGGSNIIDVHVSHLRNKLEDRPPKLIRTVFGTGYALYPDGQDS